MPSGRQYLNLRPRGPRFVRVHVCARQTPSMGQRRIRTCRSFTVRQSVWSPTGPQCRRPGSGRLGHAAGIAAGIVRCGFDRCRRQRLRRVGEQLRGIVWHRLTGIDDRIRFSRCCGHAKSEPASPPDLRAEDRRGWWPGRRAARLGSDAGLRRGLRFCTRPAGCRGPPARGRTTSTPRVTARRNGFGRCCTRRSGGTSRAATPSRATTTAPTTCWAAGRVGFRPGLVAAALSPTPGPRHGSTRRPGRGPRPRLRPVAEPRGSRGAARGARPPARRMSRPRSRCRPIG